LKYTKNQGMKTGLVMLSLKGRPLQLSLYWSIEVDWLTKYSYFVGLSHHPFIANEIAAMFHLHDFFSPIVLERPDFFWGNHGRSCFWWRVPNWCPLLPTPTNGQPYRGGQSIWTLIEGITIFISTQELGEISL